MRARILIGITAAIFLAAQVVFAQAAAESVLLNSNSAAATAKAGTSLGNALNRAGSSLGGQIQNIPQSKVVTHPALGVHKTETASQARQVAQTKNPPLAAKPASGGSMITSVQGGRVTRSTPPSTPQK